MEGHRTEVFPPLCGTCSAEVSSSGDPLRTFSPSPRGRQDPCITSVLRLQQQLCERPAALFCAVFGTSTLYGPKQLIYNVHTLRHLAEECLIHGPLDAFSEFGFENFLGKLKRMLRTHNPLAQVSRRLSERAGLASFQTATKADAIKEGQCYLLNDQPAVIVKVCRISCDVAALTNPRDFFKAPSALVCN